MRICVGVVLELDKVFNAACTVLYWPEPSAATRKIGWLVMLLQSAVVGVVGQAAGVMPLPVTLMLSIFARPLVVVATSLILLVPTLSGTSTFTVCHCAQLLLVGKSSVLIWLPFTRRLARLAPVPPLPKRIFAA